MALKIKFGEGNNEELVVKTVIPGKSKSHLGRLGLVGHHAPLSGTSTKWVETGAFNLLTKTSFSAWERVSERASKVNCTEQDSDYIG